MLSDKIKTLRTARGINQIELAKSLGVTKQCVSNWENDNIQPSVEMLIKIASFFMVTTDYLLGLETERKIILYLNTVVCLPAYVYGSDKLLLL